jgi:hypothetical protein
MAQQALSHSQMEEKFSNKDIIVRTMESHLVKREQSQRPEQAL